MTSYKKYVKIVKRIVTSTFKTKCIYKCIDCLCVRTTVNDNNNESRSKTFNISPDFMLVIHCEGINTNNK